MGRKCREGEPTSGCDYRTVRKVRLGRPGVWRGGGVGAGVGLAQGGASAWPAGSSPGVAGGDGGPRVRTKTDKFRLDPEVRDQEKALFLQFLRTLKKPWKTGISTAISVQKEELKISSKFIASWASVDILSIIKPDGRLSCTPGLLVWKPHWARILQA